MTKPSEVISVEIMENPSEVVIHIPMSLCQFSQSQREDPIYIEDLNDAAEYLSQYIMGLDNPDYANGLTSFEIFLDDVFETALTSGENWVHGWWENNEEEDENVE